MRKRLQQLLLALATMIKEVNQERTRRNLPKEIPPKKRKANQLQLSLRASSAVTRIKGKENIQISDFVESLVIWFTGLT